jgi:hypothetical protein
MKKALLLLAIVLLIVSCRNHEPAKEYTIPKLSEKDSLIKKFAPIINGDWVRADYVNDLKKTLSPKQSYHDIGEDECCLYINSSSISSDTLQIAISYGGAGSAEYITTFKKGIKPNSIVMERTSPYEKVYQLGFKITANDTTLLLFCRDDKDSNITIERSYFRARDELTGNDSIVSATFPGITYFHNKLLVSGKYDYSDSTGHKRTAEFNDYGKVSGIAGFKTYYVEGVFGQGPGDDTDAIIFNMYQKNSKDYLLKIFKDSLYLYKDTFNDSTVSYGNGGLAFKFIRQK